MASLLTAMADIIIRWNIGFHMTPRRVLWTVTDIMAWYVAFLAHIVGWWNIRPSTGIDLLGLLTRGAVTEIMARYGASLYIQILVSVDIHLFIFIHSDIFTYFLQRYPGGGVFPGAGPEASC